MTHLYAATGKSFARITQDTQAWHAKLTLTDRRVQCLAASPQQPAEVYVGTRGDGVWKSRDEGQNWQQLAFPERDVFSLAVSAADGAVYAGCEPSRLFVSRDKGANWHELEALQQIPSKPSWSFPPRPWTSHVRSIAPAPHDPKLLLVGIELGGLMLSEDGGKSFSDHRTGAVKDVHSLAWHPRINSRAYQAGGTGTAWTQDGGVTWVAANDGRDRHYAWALAVDPGDPDTWFTSAAPGPRQAHDQDKKAEAYIYRWQGTGPWQPLTTGLPAPLESFAYCLAWGQDELFAGFGNGKIFHSNDRGDSWRALSLSGDPLSKILALHAVP